jgi:type VI secretion system secreted protein Hcp
LEDTVAVDYFLKIDGISGESKDAKHKGEIDVEAWSWGETLAVPSGAGGGAGKVDIQALTLTAGLSKASPQLMLACASGKHIKNAVLTGRRAGKGQAEFFTFTLDDVLVTSYQVAGGAGDEIGPLDSISLDFSKILVKYRETKSDGSLGPLVKFGWDVKKNAPL